MKLYEIRRPPASERDVRISFFALSPRTGFAFFSRKGWRIICGQHGLIQGGLAQPLLGTIDRRCLERIKTAISIMFFVSLFVFLFPSSFVTRRHWQNVVHLHLFRVSFHSHSPASLATSSPEKKTSRLMSSCFGCLKDASDAKLMQDDVAESMRNRVGNLCAQAPLDANASIWILYCRVCSRNRSQLSVDECEMFHQRTYVNAVVGAVLNYDKNNECFRFAPLQ